MKGYLAICVANRARNVIRQARQIDPERLAERRPESARQPDSSELVSDAELHQRVRAALANLPAEQHDAIVLHVLGSLRFREIARQTGEPVNTVRSRYRYGIAKLRSLLDGQVEP